MTSIFPTYQQANARKSNDAVILHSKRTPWTREDRET